MSFLKKVLAKNNKFPEEFEGVEIVERRKEDFGKQGSGGGVGMHYLDEKSDLTDDSIEFHRLIDNALNNNFKTLYIYNQGGTKSRPHLYLIKSSADESKLRGFVVADAKAAAKEHLAATVNFLKKNPPKEDARKALVALSDKLMHSGLNKKDPSIIEALDDLEGVFKKYESDLQFKKPIAYLRSLV